MSENRFSLNSPPVLLSLSFLTGAALGSLLLLKKKLSKNRDHHKRHDKNQVSIFRKQIEKEDLVQSEFYNSFLNSLDNNHYIKYGMHVTGHVFNSCGVYFKRPIERLIQAAHLFESSNENNNTRLLLYCIVNFNSKAEGREGQVDEGLVGSIVDHLLGTFSPIANNYNSHATAYLKVENKKPVYINKDVMIVVNLGKIVGKKVFLEARVMNEGLEICAEFHSLLLTVNWGDTFWQNHSNKRK